MGICSLLSRLPNIIPLWVHILGCCLGTVGGFIGGFILIGHFGNIHAGFWCFLSALVALCTLHLLVLHYYRNLDVYHTEKSLKALYWTGIGGIAAGGLAALVYVIFSIIHQVGFFPVEDSLLIAAVQAFMVLKFSVNLTFFAKKFANIVKNGYETSFDIIA